jgi:hypothetical protein
MPSELTMMDPMFAARVPRSALLAKNYSEWFNVPSHGFAPREVDEILQSLVRRKLVWKQDLSAWTAHCQVRENDSLRVQTSRFASEKRWWSELRDLHKAPDAEAILEE